MHEEAAAEAAPAADTKAADPKAADPKAAGNSVQLGYKTFTDGNDAFQYFSYLLNKITHNQDINEYEHQSLLALLEKGHANAATKVRGWRDSGVVAMIGNTVDVSGCTQQPRVHKYPTAPPSHPQLHLIHTKP